MDYAVVHLMKLVLCSGQVQSCSNATDIYTEVLVVFFHSFICTACFCCCLIQGFFTKVKPASTLMHTDVYLL